MWWVSIRLRKKGSVMLFEQVNSYPSWDNLRIACEVANESFRLISLALKSNHKSLPPIYTGNCRNIRKVFTILWGTQSLSHTVGGMRNAFIPVVAASGLSMSQTLFQIAARQLTHFNVGPYVYSLVWIGQSGEWNCTVGLGTSKWCS